PKRGALPGRERFRADQQLVSRATGTEDGPKVPSPGERTYLSATRVRRRWGDGHVRLRSAREECCPSKPAHPTERERHRRVLESRPRCRQGGRVPTARRRRSADAPAGGRADALVSRREPPAHATRA